MTIKINLLVDFDVNVNVKCVDKNFLHGNGLIKLTTWLDELPFKNALLCLVFLLYFPHNFMMASMALGRLLSRLMKS